MLCDIFAANKVVSIYTSIHTDSFFLLSSYNASATIIGEQTGDWPDGTRLNYYYFLLYSEAAGYSLWRDRVLCLVSYEIAGICI